MRYSCLEKPSFLAIFTRNGKWYLYVCLTVNWQFGLAVAVADNPAGPYVDALGKALIYGNSSGSDYDPAPFIDDDGQAYLYWGGNPDCFYVKLNEDMITTSGPIVKVTNQLDTFQEGPEIWKLNWCCAIERDSEFGLILSVLSGPESSISMVRFTLPMAPL